MAAAACWPTYGDGRQWSITGVHLLLKHHICHSTLCVQLKVIVFARDHHLNLHALCKPTGHSTSFRIRQCPPSPQDAQVLMFCTFPLEPTAFLQMNIMFSKTYFTFLRAQLVECSSIKAAAPLLNYFDLLLTMHRCRHFADMVDRAMMHVGGTRLAW